MASGKCILPFLRKYFVKKLLFLTENNLALRQETEPTTAMALDFEEFLHAFAHRAILFFGAVSLAFDLCYEQNKKPETQTLLCPCIRLLLPYLHRLFGEGSYTVFLFSSMTTTPSPFLRTIALFPRLRIASMAATALLSTFTINIHHLPLTGQVNSCLMMLIISP